MRARRATRHFLPEAVDRTLVERLLAAAQWAPSGFNAQPVRFLVVEDRAIRPALRKACMDQPQVEEAPLVVVFLGDRKAFSRRYEEVLVDDLRRGAIDGKYADFMRRTGRLVFGHGPFGLGWLWKAALLPIARWFRPVPILPAVHQSYWLAKQVMLNAMSFLLAAEAAGLKTVPMEGFDTGRLSRVLELPPELEPVLVVPIGYGAPEDKPKRGRLPLSSVLSWR